MKFLILPLFFLVSCSAKLYPLKGQYSSTPYQINTTSTKEQVWDRIIDLFAQKGLPIKIIDKSSGLIISEKSQLATTTEDKNGEILDKDAWVAVPGRYDGYKRKMVPATYGPAIGEWNIRIKDNNAGGCIVNVNIVNLKQVIPDIRNVSTERPLLSGRSTGVFEQLVSEMVR